jgi:hypothetical protein
MLIEISCLNVIWGIVFLGILAFVGGTSAPKDSPKYKAYARLLGYCVLFGIFLTILSIALSIFNIIVSLTVVP